MIDGLARQRIEAVLLNNLRQTHKTRSHIGRELLYLGINKAR
jgi:hypothetical protein